MSGPVLCQFGRGVIRGLRRLAAAAAAALFLVSPVLAQQDSMLGPYQRYEDARLRGDLEAAVEYAAQALNSATAEFGAESPDAVKAMLRLADAMREVGRLDESRRLLQQALDVSESVLGENHPELVPLLELLAETSLELGDLEQASNFLERALGIEVAVYGEQHDVVVTTLTALLEIYEQSGQDDKVRDTESRIVSATTVTRDLEVFDDQSRRYQASEGFATVRVFYGTNRAPTGKSKPSRFYGGDRGEMEVGYVDVTIPETHKYGQLETETGITLYNYILGEEGRKRRYVLLQTVVPLSAERFHSTLDRHIEDSPSDDVFVFIHGYNVTFEDAARRAAQLAYDLDFEGTPAFYSWPSKASTAAYTVDEAVVRPSGRKLVRFLDGLIHETRAERIHLVAHSMGNRALIEALQAYVLKYGREYSREAFDQVVFTAPDVDREYFLETVEEVSSVAKRVTLYASKNDLALKTSRILHGATRAGLAGNDIISHGAIDTIDVSGIDADVLGHSYFAVNEGAIYDLFRLFWRGDPPPKRCSMSSKMSTTTMFWQFDLDNCRGSDLLEAGLIYRRFGDGAVERLKAHIETIDEEDEDKDEWLLILDRLNSLIDSLQ